MVEATQDLVQRLVSQIGDEKVALVKEGPIRYMVLNNK
jgi:hypothetical protein